MHFVVLESKASLRTTSKITQKMDTFACNITDNSTAEAKHGGFSVNNMIGLGLAVSSSFFIGASFVINKKSAVKM